MTSPDFLPELAIIIPVWKQPGFLHESVTSALAQRADFPIAIVIVNDGCPLEETDRVGRMLARAHPSVFYLRQPNRGLSGARNAGAAFALARWPELRAIFPLDADNLLRPHAMRHALAALDQARAGAPDIGWIYPDIDMFGDPISTDYSGEYSALLHTQLNICEAGSLIAREVFDAGVRYDEAMRQGWEDWEFWLSAVDAGFRGQHLRDFGFCYRRRAQSMLTQTATMEAHLYHNLMARHKRLFSPRNLLTLEHHEAPRFAQVDGADIRLFTDPAHPVERLTLPDFARRIRAARGHQTRYGLPELLLSLPPEALAAKTLYNMLWHMERDALRHGQARQGQAAMLRMDMLGGNTPPAEFAELARAVGPKRRQRRWDWRVASLPWRLQMHDIARRHLGGAVLSAHLPDDLPCLLIEDTLGAKPDKLLMNAIEHFAGTGPFHLALAGDTPPHPDLADTAATIAHLPADDPTACAGFLAAMARILIALPKADPDLLSALKRSGPQLWLYVDQEVQAAAAISHVVTGMIAANRDNGVALMAQGVSAGMIEYPEKSG